MSDFTSFTLSFLIDLETGVAVRRADRQDERSAYASEQAYGHGILEIDGRLYWVGRLPHNHPSRASEWN
jgi:hypothetical protein